MVSHHEKNIVVWLCCQYEETDVGTILEQLAMIILKSVAHCQGDVRPTVTFPSA